MAISVMPSHSRSESARSPGPIAYIRQRAAIAPETRSRFDEDFSIVLRRAVAQTLD
jgi:hypothetical protein